MQGSGNKPLPVDILARELPDRVALWAGLAGDEAEAVAIVRDLASVFEAYELRLRAGAEAARSGSGFVGRPILAKFASACAVCRGAIRINDEILYDRDRSGMKAAHVRCGEVAP